MVQQLERGSFEHRLATLVLGVDTLWGGNIDSPSGVDHFIADSWTSGLPFPEIMNDPFAEALRQDGAGVLTKKDQRREVLAFIEKYALDTLPNTIREDVRKIERETHDEDRVVYLRNLISALDVMRDRAMAEVGLCDAPSYEAMYAAATRSSVIFSDPAPYRENLRSALAGVGFETTASRNLQETLVAWQASRKLSTDEVPATVTRMNAELLAKTRQALFAKVLPNLAGHAADLSDLAFDGMVFQIIPQAFFTGSNAYSGGEREGRPLLAGLYEFNIEHVGTEIDMLHLSAHEMMPGHYLSNAMRDLLFRANRLGFEATIGTMATPEIVFLEGWAENAFELLYGSREAAIDAHGPELAVIFACCELESLGKHNASVLYNRDHVSIEKLRERLATEYAQPPALVKKLSGPFVTHPILGAMYAPSYHLGTRLVSQAIADHGVLAVAKVGMYLEGMIDIETMHTKLDLLRRYDSLGGKQQ